MRVDHYESLISAYVNGTLKTKDRNRVEDLIASNEKFGELYRQKKELKDFYLALVPKFQISKNREDALKKEMYRVNAEVFPEDKYEPLKKVYKFLTEPIIEI